MILNVWFIINSSASRYSCPLSRNFQNRQQQRGKIRTQSLIIWNFFFFPLIFLSPRLNQIPSDFMEACHPKPSVDNGKKHSADRSARYTNSSSPHIRAHHIYLDINFTLLNTRLCREQEWATISGGILSWRRKEKPMLLHFCRHRFIFNVVRLTNLRPLRREKRDNAKQRAILRFWI